MSQRWSMLYAVLDWTGLNTDGLTDGLTDRLTVPQVRTCLPSEQGTKSLGLETSSIFRSTLGQHPDLHMHLHLQLHPPLVPRNDVSA